MKTLRLATGLWVAMALVCCTADEEQQASIPPEGTPAPEDTPAQSQGGLACLDQDSVLDGRLKLVFSNVVGHDETGDLSGAEFTFERRRDSWSGFARSAAGEFGPMYTVDSLTVDLGSGDISFMVPGGSDTMRFEGTLACDTLRGTMKVFGRAYPSKFGRVY